MQYEQIAINELKPYKNNARVHSKAQVKLLANSIKEFGFLNPVLVDKNNGVIAGHGRLEAAILLKLDTVPVLRVEHLTEAQKRAYIIADNRLAELSEWDKEILTLELEELQGLDVDLKLTGFELDTKTKGRTDPDEIPPVEKNAHNVQRGQVWQLGAHRLMCGDSTNADDVGRLMNGEKANIMYTDPPYGVNLDQSWRDKALGEKAMGKGNVNIIKNDDRADWIETYSLFNGDIAYVWHDACQTDVVKRNLEDVGLETKQMIVWNKSIMVMGRSNYHWKHEPCWYCIRKGKTSNWSGDHKQTTVWVAPSPNLIMS